MSKENWIIRVRAGLQKSSKNLSEGIAGIFQGKQIDVDTLEELEELLIMADLGPQTASKLTIAIEGSRSSRANSSLAIKTQLVRNITQILAPLALPIQLNPLHKPTIFVFVGVNGTGKTTTIGKLAQQLGQNGQRVGIVAADTFRAAATEQLQQWGERAGCFVFAGKEGSDPSGLVYSAAESAHNKGLDGLLIDTAGRLHTKNNLMEELAKIARVLEKLNPEYPHGIVQVLDATTGQNTLSQVASFKKTINVSGLIVTKLDGSARGGGVVALADQFGLPIHAVGVGEDIDDLQPFSAQKFAQGLLGLSNEAFA